MPMRLGVHMARIPPRLAASLAPEQWEKRLSQSARPRLAAKRCDLRTLRIVAQPCDERLPQSLAAQDEFDDLADGAPSAGGAGDVVGVGPHLGAGVGDGD